MSTKIAWAMEVWNPIVGCSVVSPGCAMKMAGTRLKYNPTYACLTKPSKAGAVWTGAVRLIEDRLSAPLKWRKPRRIFVNSMGDLFHENVPGEWIDRVFAVMAHCPQHQFIVLTKRAVWMRNYMQGCERRVAQIVYDSHRKYGTSTLHDADWNTLGFFHGLWPLPNVILGVSVEDQTRANERIPLLLETPAAMRCVSYEPPPVGADIR